MSTPQQKSTGKYKKLLVTGAAGFIGRTLVQMLADRGYEVIALDSFRFSNKDQIVESPSIRWVEGDTRDWPLVDGLVSEVDAVIHLAAPSSFLMHEENDLEACNFTIMGFKTVMEAVKKHKIPKVVWASTSAVYEGQSFPYDESMVPNPPDSKAGCKVFCEQEAQRYNDRYGITCIAMRPFSVYGTGEHTKRGYANVISLFAWAMMAGEQPVLWGDGEQTRDYIFVDDAARAFLLALETDIPTQALNVGTGIETTFNDVVKMIGEELNMKVEPVYVPVPIKIYAERLQADMKRVQSVLGFEPTIRVREGIRKVIEAARALTESQREQLMKDQNYYRTLEKK